MKPFIKTRKTVAPALIFVLTAAFSAALLSSCKKEYIDKYNIVPGDTVLVSGLTNIISFTLKEFSQDTLVKAAITPDDTIIVYWPTYKDIPAEISPEIIVNNKATINPASGAAVAFETGTQYTVKAEDGTEKTYTLKLAPKQAPIIAEFGGNSYRRNAVTILCQRHIQDIAKTSVVIETLDKSASYTGIVNRVRPQDIRFAVPNDTPPGKYIVKLTSGYITQYITKGTEMYEGYAVINLM